MFLRKVLIKIRKMYNTQPKKLFGWSGAVTFVLIVIGVLLDWLLPWTFWAQCIRGLVVIPMSVSMFTLGYSFSLFLHYSKLEVDPDWQPYRLRYSVKWRRRIALIVGAVLFILMYSSNFGIAYTLTAGIFLSAIIGIFSFIRTTKNEENREQLGLPDNRDTRYDENMKKLEKQREQAKIDKEERRKKRRDKILLGQKFEEKNYEKNSDDKNNDD